MALAGAWKDGHSIQAGARKWGTGINSIHSDPGEGPPLIESKQIYNGPGVGDGMQDAVPDEMTEQYQHYDGEEYDGGNMWGYGNDTGTADRPPFGTPTQDFRGDSRDFPQWGPYEDGIPGGSAIRDDSFGAQLTERSKQVPNETVSEGWLNKAHGHVSDSRVSDPSQIFMQTSQTQRYKARSGTQMPEGREDEHSATIESRVVGKKVKWYSGEDRHYDMQPQSQDPIIRRWWSRGAGTGDPSLLQTNYAYESHPMTRNVPPDPYQGEPVGTMVDQDYGYQDEDVIPYA